MLVSLLYVSRAVGPQTTSVTSSILSTARGSNPVHGITGALFQGQGLYLQVIEGERSAVNRLYACILGDIAIPLSRFFPWRKLPRAGLINGPWPT